MGGAGLQSCGTKNISDRPREKTSCRWENKIKLNLKGGTKKEPGLNSVRSW
jgi:hypothetical protein